MKVRGTAAERERVDLRRLRMNQGLTLRRLSELTGVPKSTLARIENGGSAPVPSTQLKIASFFGFKPTDIWPLEENGRANGGRKA